MDFFHQESALYFFQKRELCQQIVMVDQTTLDIFFLSLQRCYCILRVVTSNSFTKCKQGRSQYADSNLLSMVVFVELHFSFYEKINVK